MKCINCNSEIPEGLFYCPVCGYSLQPGGQPVPPPASSQGYQQPGQPGGYYQQPQQPAGYGYQQPGGFDSDETRIHANGPVPPGAPVGAPAPVGATGPKGVPMPPKSKSNTGLIIGIVAAAVVLIGGLVWWLMGRSGGSSDLEKMVPANSLAVVNMNVGQLLTDAGVTISGDKVKLPEKVQAAMSSGDVSDMNETMEKIAKSGIDFGSTAYAFITNDALQAAVLLPLSKPDNTKKWMQEEMGETWTDGGEYSSIQSGGTLFLIRDKVLLIGVPNESNSEADAMKMALECVNKKVDNITSNSEAVAALHKGSGMNFYANIGKSHKMLMKSSSEYRREMESNPMATFFDEIQDGTASLSLKDNQLSLDGHVNVTKGGDLEQLTSKVFADPSTDFLKFIPGDCDVVFAASINGANVAQLDMVSSAIRQSGFEDFKIADLIKSIKGPVAIGFKAERYSGDIPPISVVLTCEKVDVLKGIIDMLNMFGGDMIKPNGDGGYVLNPGDGSRIYLGSSGNCIYFSTLTLPTESSSAFSNSDIKSLFKQSRLGLWGQLNSGSYTFHGNLSSPSSGDVKANVFVVDNSSNKRISLVEWALASDEFQKKLDF